MHGIIEIKLDGATTIDTERYRLLIHTLFVEGVFNIKAGSATLHFDDLGVLKEIEYNFRRRRDKPSLPLQEGGKNATIAVQK
jgi:hypothetical protein